MIKLLITFLVLFCSTLCAIEDKIGSETGYKIPRFVSLKSNDSNLRIGSSINFPIILNYNIKNLPLQIVEERDNWRKVIDYDNNQGWIHKSIISGNRYGIINQDYDALIHVLKKPRGMIVGKIGKRNIVKINKCLIDWCYITHDKINGWVNKENLWGVYKNEKFNVPFYQFIINQVWKIDF